MVHRSPDSFQIVGDSSMFDLNQSIASWRNTQRSKASLSESEVVELEDHLRESVDRLSSGELSEEEAFLVASRRLGAPESLAQEFDKVRPSATVPGWVWFIVGYLALSMLNKGMTTLVLGIGALSISWGFESWVTLVLLYGTVLLYFVFLVLYAMRWVGRNPWGTSAIGVRILNMATTWTGAGVLLVAVMLYPAVASLLRALLISKVTSDVGTLSFGQFALVNATLVQFLTGFIPLVLTVVLIRGLRRSKGQVLKQVG